MSARKLTALTKKQPATPMDAMMTRPAQRADQQPGNTIKKSDHSDRHRRPCQIPDQPALSDVLHEVPGARNERALQEQTKITMSDCPKRSNFPEFLHALPPSMKC